MSNRRKETMKLSEQGVITGEALLAYLRNELSTEEKQEVEKLLHEDPFAQDALEGLRSSVNKEAVAGSLLSLHKKVRERVGIKDKRSFNIHWVNYVWIAVVLGLLIGISFVIVNYLGKNAQHATGNEKSQGQNVNTATQKLQQPEPPKIVPDTAAHDSTAAAKDTVHLVSSSENTKLTAPTGNNAVTGPEKNKPASSSSGNQAIPVSVPKPAAANGATAISTPSGNTKQGKNNTTPSASSEDEKVNVPAAMKDFYSGDYKKAAEQFDKILKGQPDNADALYFGGISYYIDGKAEKSEKNFDKLLKEGTSYIDGAKWYKANILLKKGDIEHSKSLLQELSNTNGSYKERATKKLADMGQ